MWKWLQRLLPHPRLERPRTVQKRGAITETRTNLAVHFHFDRAPSQAPKASKLKPAATKPRPPARSNPLTTWLLGPKTKPLTRAQVRALPTAPAPPDPLAPLRALTGAAFPTRQEVEDTYAIARMQARAPRVRMPSTRPARVKPVPVEGHMWKGQWVEQHTRKKPTTAKKAERTAK